MHSELGSHFCRTLCETSAIKARLGFKHSLYVSDYQLSGPAALRGDRQPLNAAAPGDRLPLVAERQEVEEAEEEEEECLFLLITLRSCARGSSLTLPCLPVMFSCLGIIPCKGADKQSWSRGDTCTATSTGL